MVDRPPDRGPIYAETDLTQFIAEPWNALSSLAILLPAVYWGLYLKERVREFSFIYFCVPLLFLGGTGSTLFHAFRAHRAFLVMDFMPTAILMLSVTVYFWYKVLPKVWMVPLVILGTFGLRFVFFYAFPDLRSINSNYFFTGTMIFLPVIAYLHRHAYRNLVDILISVLTLLLALFFREMDHSFSEYLPMGSHFLWHISSGVGAFFLARFLYKLRLQEINEHT